MKTVDVEPNEEILRQYKPIKPGATFKYVPIVFRQLPEGEQPVFTLRSIGGMDLAELEDLMHGKISFDNGKSEMVMERGRFVVEVCKRGVVGWENFFGVPFDSTLQCLQQRLLVELCNAITEYRGLEKEESLG